MAKTNRRKRHRILALAAAGAVALVVVLIVAIVIVVLRRPDAPPTAVPPSAVPPAGVPPTSKPRPDFQDASCPDVQLVSIPGTWESSVTLDPFNPVQFPAALLLNVTNPLRAQFGADRLEVFHELVAELESLEADLEVRGRDAERQANQVARHKARSRDER